MAARKEDPGPTTDVFNPPPGANAADDQTTPAPTGRCLVTISDMRAGETITRQGKTYPIIGGRLRAFREDWGEHGGIDTEFVPALSKGELTVFVCTITGNGKLLARARGTCTARDFQGRETRIEMAETRSVARALRLAGYGVDGTGLEEMEGPDMQTAPNQGEPPGMIQRRSVQELTKKARELKVDISDLTPLGPSSTSAEASKLIETLAARIKAVQNGGFHTADGQPAEKSATVSAKNGSAPRRGTPTKTA